MTSITVMDLPHVAGRSHIRLVSAVVAGLATAVASAVIVLPGGGASGRAQRPSPATGGYPIGCLSAETLAHVPAFARAGSDRAVCARPGSS